MTQDELDRERFLQALTQMPWRTIPDFTFDSTRSWVYGVQTSLLVTTTMPGHEPDVIDLIRLVLQGQVGRGLLPIPTTLPRG